MIEVTTRSGGGLNEIFNSYEQNEKKRKTQESLSCVYELNDDFKKVNQHIVRPGENPVCCREVTFLMMWRLRQVQVRK